MRAQFLRYMTLAKRKTSQMPLYAVLDYLEDMLTSPHVVEMYPDYPKCDIESPLHMYIAADYQKTKEKYPHMTYYQVEEVSKTTLSIRA